MEDDSEFEFFHQKIKANLPLNATELVRFLKCVRSLGFLKRWFF